MPQPFAEDERVAAQDYGDVVVPATEGATLEVIESELALEVFVYALGAPSFLRDSDELLAARHLFQPCERVVCRRLLAVGPLDEEPVVVAVFVAGVDLDHRKSRDESTTASLLPRGGAKRLAREEPC